MTATADRTQALGPGHGEQSGSSGSSEWGNDRRRLLDLVGGVRGAVDGGVPPLIFVLVNVGAGAVAARATALGWAIAAALGAGLLIVAVRLRQSEPLKRAFVGLGGLGVAVVFAAASGQARGFFLPGMLVDAAYAVAFAGSAAVGRPLVGILHGLLYGRRGQWRRDVRVRRIFAIATLGWSLVFTIRAGVQAHFYVNDLPAMMAVAKLILGWPLSLVAVILTLAYLHRALRAAATQPQAFVELPRQGAGPAERATSAARVQAGRTPGAAKR